MTSNEKLMAGLGLISLGIFILALGPLLAIWSWNELFGDIKTIEYTFWNWLAVAFLGVFIRGVVKIEKRKY